MSVPAALHPLARARPVARARVLGCAALALVLALRVALVWQRATPNYFPDEYLYASLGRALAHFQAPAVRGQSAHFPALLQPVVTAPAWRAASLETGYRLVQAINAVALTLTAIPAWLLARRLGLSRAVALTSAALALLVPDALYASFVLAEPLTYPLVVAASAAAVLAVGSGSRRAQAAFLVFAALAAFARIQFAALPLCYLVALATIALRNRSPRALLREQAVALGGLAAGVLAVAGAGASRLAGYYATALHPHVHAAAALKEAAVNAMVLAYAGGWIIIPGAILGIALALGRPRSRIELAFGAFALALVAVVLVESAVFGATALPQERYTFYVAPLGVIAFGLYASRGWPLRAVHASLALGLLLVSARVPLSRWALPGGDDHSPFLLAVQQVERVLHGSAAGAGLVAGIAGALALAAVAASLRPRRGTAVVLALAVAFSGGAYAAAARFDMLNSRNERSQYLPADRSWVDAVAPGRPTLVVAPGSRPSASEEQLFWNSSLQRVVLLPGAAVPDPFRTETLTVAADGKLLAAGRTLAGPLVVDEFAATVVLRNARREAGAPHFDLWQPNGPAQLSALMIGRYADGLLAPRGMVELWPSRSAERLSGRLELDVRATATAPLVLELGGRRVRVPAGGRASVRVPVCASRGPWRTGFVATGRVVRDGRPVAGSSSAPRFVPDVRACSRG